MGQIGGIASKDLDGGIGDAWDELSMVDLHGLGLQVTNVRPGDTAAT
jgi:hypothetical protein